MKRLSIFVLAVFFSYMCLCAKKNKLIVHYCDGVTTGINLSDNPVIRYHENLIDIICAQSIVVEIPEEDLKYFLYEDEAACIETIDLSNTRLHSMIKGESLHITGLKAGTRVAVNTLSGIKLAELNVNEDGDYIIPFPNFSDRIFLVTINGHTYKIVKK